MNPGRARAFALGQLRSWPRQRCSARHRNHLLSRHDAARPLVQGVWGAVAVRCPGWRTAREHRQDFSRCPTHTALRPPGSKRWAPRLTFCRPAAGDSVLPTGSASQVTRAGACASAVDWRDTVAATCRIFSRVVGALMTHIDDPRAANGDRKGTSNHRLPWSMIPGPAMAVRLSACPSDR